VIASLFVEGDRFLVAMETKECDRFSDLWEAIAFWLRWRRRGAITVDKVWE
jgi:hypothetical protein